MDIIDFDVGGTYYSTTITTLSQVSDNLLLKLAKETVPVVKKSGRIFIDRDGELFKYILQYLRNTSLWSIPDNVNIKQLILEAGYYLITPLIEKLQNKLRIITYNYSFTYYICDHSNGLPIYRFVTHGVKDTLKRKKITKNNLYEAIIEYMEYFNGLGYKLVCTDKIKVPVTSIYYFEKC
jgi:hypothetical protein